MVYHYQAAISKLDPIRVTELFDSNFNIYDSKTDFKYKIDINEDAFDSQDIEILEKAKNQITSMIIENITFYCTFQLIEMQSGILGGAMNTGFKRSGFVQLNTLYWNTARNTMRTDGNSSAYYILVHEMMHALGYGTTWNAHIIDGKYIGVNALREYRNTIGYDQITHVPIENDGGGGTAGYHLEEGEETSTPYVDQMDHPGLDREIMTGWIESDNEPMVLSKITIGILDDIGYQVNYDANTEFNDWQMYNNRTGGYLSPDQTVNVTLNDKYLSIKAGTTMKTNTTHGPYNERADTIQIYSDGILLVWKFILYFTDNTTKTINEDIYINSSTVYVNISNEYTHSSQKINAVQLIYKKISYKYPYNYF